MTKQIVLPFVLISTQTNVYIFLSLSYSLSYFLFSWKPNKVTERHFEFYSIFSPIALWFSENVTVLGLAGQSLLFF